MPTFNVGQIVNLKSSPDVPMTIELVNGQIAHCKWLNKNDDPKLGPFSFDVLEVYVSFQDELDKAYE